MDVETIEPEPCELPSPQAADGQGRKRLDLKPVMDWLWDHPGEWCRLAAANNRSFTLLEVQAIRARLANLFTADEGPRRVSIQTRPSGQNGRDVYARRETEQEWYDRNRRAG